MANVRKGQLVREGWWTAWHKHLRRRGKRSFWKRNRKAERVMIRRDLAS